MGTADGPTANEPIEQQGLLRGRSSGTVPNFRTHVLFIAKDSRRKLVTVPARRAVSTAITFAHSRGRAVTASRSCERWHQPIMESTNQSRQEPMRREAPHALLDEVSASIEVMTFFARPQKNY